MKRIKEIRQSKGMSQKDLAQACGLRSATVCWLERDKVQNPRLETLLKISSVLGVSVNELLEERQLESLSASCS